MAEVGHLGVLGPCWWEECDDAGAQLVLGVPVSPARPVPDLVATAERITRLGVVVCAGHAPLARTLAGLR